MPDCRLTRRRAIGAVVGTAALFAAGGAAATTSVRFGLTQVLLVNDIQLLSELRVYLEAAIDAPVELTTRRTYQEGTGLLLAGELDAAWICGYPYVQHRDELVLLAAPSWRGAPLYRSYLITDADRAARSFWDLRGDVHAFSDPDSNSGYLVTVALLKSHGLDPASFFSRIIFTYGHRNVIRAVASGLAQSGSVESYVWEMVSEMEPDLTAATRVVRRSELLGFPPIAASRLTSDAPGTQALRRALLGMSSDERGRSLLQRMRFDSFVSVEPSLYDAIAAKAALMAAVQ